MGLLDVLKQKWKLDSWWQVIIILLVFACTGFTVMAIKKPILVLINPSGEMDTFYTVMYYLLIWPIYNLVLLGYGFLFGHFHFFLSFEKKMWYRITGQKPKGKGTRE